MSDRHKTCMCGSGLKPRYDEAIDDWLCDECYEQAWDEYHEAQPEFDPDFDYDGPQFADPGGNSALRAETRINPRNLPCPTCGMQNRLTPEDQKLGYQCNSCADSLERGGF